MKTINFRQFKIFTDITRTHEVISDVSLSLADHIYKNANGVLAHDLAFRIYESKGEIELTEQEEIFLNHFVERMTPAFQDSYYANLKEANHE